MRESAREDPYSTYRPPTKNFFFDLIISNERSSQTIVKSKILDHLALPVKNASCNKYKGVILTSKNRYSEGMFSILTLSHDQLDCLSSKTSHLIENNPGYKFILLESLIYGMKKMR